MTPKDNPLNHDADDSADDSWREDSKRAAAVVALRDYGLLPRTHTTSTTVVTRLACRTSSPVGSWYCSSSDDEDDEGSFGDGPDNDDDETNDNNESEMSNTRGSCSPSSKSGGLCLTYETELVVGFRGSLYDLGNNSIGGYGIGYSLHHQHSSYSEQQQQEEAEEEARNEAKFHEDEKVFQSNLSRRSIRFVEHPQVKEYEPAPFNLHSDLYYSCHQLQKMMDEHNAEQQHQPNNNSTADDDFSPESHEPSGHTGTPTHQLPALVADA